MSVDMLLTASGRLASLARNSSTQARVAGDEQDGGSDPATIFGALLEKPHGKVDASGKDEAEAKSDEKEAGEGSGQKPVAVFGLPQNLLSLASALPGQQQGEGGFSAEEKAGNPAHAAVSEPGMVEAIDPAGIDKAAAEFAGDDEKRPLRDLPRVKAAQMNGDPAIRAGQVSGEAAMDISGNKPAEGAAVDVAGVKASKPATDHEPAKGVDVRADLLPQQVAAKSAVPAEAKAAAGAPGSARIADIEIVSERSFGTVKTLQIRLDPVELGAVTARIRVAGDGVEVHLVADKSHAAEMLAADRSMIEKALKVAGIGDDTKISVTVADRNAQGAAQHVAAAQNAGQQQASAQQQGHQLAFNTPQQGSQGRGGEAQAQFMSGRSGGEGGRNGGSGQAGRERANGQAKPENGRGAPHIGGRGLVV
ncbi:flagellar hook-length control protein FliK [Brucella sp. 2280]|uniref:flagellar hook-length control protein FliK n=1 Tax=Brucella sp. 2280 TaxID=2592625 RepID=UPI00129521BD|nr:flagellar hook-length control protein FliK [Brucella sp. 2280]QGA57866.1 flagellar hook-length control protein FliK [Brucella sp. 2280]